MKIKNLCLWAMGIVMACSPAGKVVQEATSEEKEYLMTIGNEDIPAEEFLHILSKTRDFEEESQKLTKEEFEENLDLFINYKLKVKEAEALGMHESEEFKREFETFKEDLKKPYLLENSLQEGEIRKAYNRMQEVVNASHILLRFPANASKEDSIAVYNMAKKLQKRIQSGEDFNSLAMEYSQDPSVENNKGNLGYFTALQMVYPFEDAVYELEPGEVSNPVLTDFGYHIIKLNDRKPNPGQVKVSHILVRIDPTDPISEDRAKRKITDIYTELQKEKRTWKEVCKSYSEDQGTKKSGGELPWFGVGSFIPEFEEMAFSLTEPGEISAPVKTPYGYHIIRLEATKPLGTYEELEESIKSKILRDSRSSLIREQVMAMQKSKYDFQENQSISRKVRSVFEKYKPGELDAIATELSGQQLMDSTLLSTQNGSKSVADFIQFIQEHKVVVKPKANQYFNPWYNKFEEFSLNEAEEAYLMQNNESFQLLVKEYRDGILLFNLMNEKVWQKALKDTSGQLSYFEQHQDHYQWEKRVGALVIKVNQKNYKDSLYAFLKGKHYSGDLKKRLEDKFLDQAPLAFSSEQGTFEYENHPVLSKVDLEKELQDLDVNKQLYLVALGETIPESPKKFSETRGKVIQDFQENLEKELVNTLKENYIIRINQDEKNRIADIVVKN